MLTEMIVQKLERNHVYFRDWSENMKEKIIIFIFFGINLRNTKSKLHFLFETRTIYGFASFPINLQINISV